MPLETDYQLKKVSSAELNKIRQKKRILSLLRTNGFTSAPTQTAETDETPVMVDAFQKVTDVPVLLNHNEGTPPPAAMDVEPLLGALLWKTRSPPVVAI